MRQITVIAYHQRGPPLEVIRVEKQDLPEPGPGQVQVWMLAAPINPSDINTIEGTYGILPPLPAIGGGEGVGTIGKLGEGVTHLRQGQRVLPPIGIGTWRQALVVAADSVL